MLLVGSKKTSCQPFLAILAFGSEAGKAFQLGNRGGIILPGEKGLERKSTCEEEGPALQGGIFGGVGTSSPTAT